MPISMLTAIRIKSGGIEVQTAGPNENGKYCFWIMPENMDRWEPLLNSEPIFETSELAKEAGEDLIEEIKNREDIP